MLLRTFGFATVTFSIVTLAGVALSIEPASAQSNAYERALDRCATAAQKAKSAAPTVYSCDWRTVVKGAPGAALTGKFAKVGRNPTGTLTILERGGAPAAVGFMTTARPSARTCTVAVDAQRAPNDALEARPAVAPGCVISIRSSKPNIVSVTTTPACQYYCGVGVGFDGDYKLLR